jgi:RHS repeat-associated protein
MDRPIIAGNVWSRSTPRLSTTLAPTPAAAPAAPEGTDAFTHIHYLLQNWRGDVSLVVTDAARVIEWVQYSAYGVPFGIPAGNASSNGANNVEDLSMLTNWIGNEVWDARWDLSADGSVTMADYAHYPEKTLGRGKLSWINNRIGYAAYQHAPELAGTKYIVRYRWLLADLAIFNRRDPHPKLYVDGMNLYQYARSSPLWRRDPSGLCSIGRCPGEPCECEGLDFALTQKQCTEAAIAALIAAGLVSAPLCVQILYLADRAVPPCIIGGALGLDHILDRIRACRLRPQPIPVPIGARPVPATPPPVPAPDPRPVPAPVDPVIPIPLPFPIPVPEEVKPRVTLCYCGPPCDEWIWVSGGQSCACVIGGEGGLWLPRCLPVP